MIQVRQLKEDKIRQRPIYIILHKTTNIIFFDCFSSRQSQSVSFLFNILPPSACSLWCRKSSVHFLVFGGQKYAEYWAGILSVIRQCHTLTRSANELTNRVALSESLQRHRTMSSCVVTVWVLLNDLKKVVAMSDPYHRFSKLDVAFCR